MTTMPERVRAAYAAEMYDAGMASNDAQKWTCLEQAHILSQPYPWPHTRNHIAMLTLALRQGDRREALGQLVRIAVAAPSSLLGRYPVGNTGRTAAGLTTPMPIPDHLAGLLTESA